MNRSKEIWIAWKTIVIKDVIRFMRLWTQTFLPSAITTFLYFVIFGNLIGSRVGVVSGISYMQYIAPGLIMMAVITNAYSNVATAFYIAKFQRNIEELLVAPVPDWVILSGYVTTGILRGFLIGIVVSIIALLFTRLHVHHLLLTLGISLLASTLFSIAGFINALYAKKFDDIAFIPTFVLTPLTYFGGVFYSITMLPAFWEKVSHLNPILYLVSMFRYGLLGVSDVNVPAAFLVTVLFTVALYYVALRLLKRGTGLRT